MKIKSLFLTTAIFLFTVLFAGCYSEQTATKSNQLVQENPVTKSVANDEVHSYTIPLGKGQYLELKIEQNDVDIIAEVFAPNGESLGEFDTPTSGRGTETVRIGADAAGEYKINIFTLSDEAEPGTYTLELAESRKLTEKDSEILEAVRLHQKGDKLRAEKETIADSIPFYEKALVIWRETYSKADEGNTLRAIAFAYQRMNELEKAKECFGKALDIWNEIGDQRSAAFTHIIFGVIAKKQNDLQKGLEYDLQAQPLWKQAGDMPEYTQNLARIGSDYVKLENKEKAFEYYEQALEESRKLNSKTLKAFVLGSYADAKAVFGEKAEAERLYQQSLEIWQVLERGELAKKVKDKIEKLKAE